MKTKIFNALKQAYSSLGLGDEFLTAQAESLASLGYVTDENLANVVASQKAFLESAQKTNDKRVADAMRKAQDDAAKAAHSAEAKQAELLKQIEEAQAKIKELSEKAKTPPGEVKDDAEIPAWFKAMQAEREKELAKLNEQMQKLSDVNTTLKTDLEKMQTEKAASEKARAAENRRNFINAKAKELGIPDWRIKQGFSFADDMDEDKIAETLTGYANDIKTNFLPNKSHSVQVDPKEITKEEAASIAKAMVR